MHFQTRELQNFVNFMSFTFSSLHKWYIKNY